MEKKAKFLLDSRFLEAIAEILERGNGVEIRKRKDGIVVLEICAKTKYTVPTNGRE